MSSPDDYPEQTAQQSTALNRAQRLHLRVSCEYIDKMLQQIESILHSAESASPFSRYKMNINPTQRRVLEDYIRRLRQQLLRTLSWQHIQPASPEIPAARAIATHLHFIKIAISELRPGAMRGSGPLSDAAARELTGILGELDSITAQVFSYVRNELEESLHQRIRKLATGEDASQLLLRLEREVTAHGLVDLRPRIEMLLARLEGRNFEVAVFGRVSSGKSSFLNALLQTAVLPVGINPITAVPTRILYGPELEASVRLGAGNLSTVGVPRFCELISEAGNPGNQEGVAQALLRIPSVRLAEGTVFVDTPGLGSLATRGTLETLAYLPSCDLGLFLIDAGNTLTIEDLGTLRLLQEARIPFIILLSKADLLTPQEQLASIEYIVAQMRQQLNTVPPVHSVSSLPHAAWMIDRFYEQELQPLLRRGKSLQFQSVHAKLARLENDILTSLEAKTPNSDAVPRLSSQQLEQLQRLLMEASGHLGTMERAVEDLILHLRFAAPELIERYAPELVEAVSGSSWLLPFAKVTRDLEALVHAEVDLILASLRNSVLQATREVHVVGRELQRGSIPDETEIGDLIRNAPRFELHTVPGVLRLHNSRLFGSYVAKMRILRALRRRVQPMMHRELSAYGDSLDAWSKHLIRDIRFTINAYADGYRALLQSMDRTYTLPEDAEPSRFGNASPTAQKVHD